MSQEAGSESTLKKETSSIPSHAKTQGKVLGEHAFLRILLPKRATFPVWKSGGMKEGRSGWWSLLPKRWCMFLHVRVRKKLKDRERVNIRKVVRQKAHFQGSEVHSTFRPREVMSCEGQRDAGNPKESTQTKY